MFFDEAGKVDVTPKQLALGHPQFWIGLICN